MNYDVSGSNERIVKAGMCFSIEPGIYIPGFAGVRIEDCIHITKDGNEHLLIRQRNCNTLADKLQIKSTSPAKVKCFFVDS